MSFVDNPVIHSRFEEPGQRTEIVSAGRREEGWATKDFQERAPPRPMRDAGTRPSYAESIQGAHLPWPLRSLRFTVRFGPVATPLGGKTRPPEIDTPEKVALFDYLDDNAQLAVALDAAIRAVKKDDWRGNLMKEREIKRAIRQYVDAAKIDDVFDLVKGQHGY